MHSAALSGLGGIYDPPGGSDSLHPGYILPPLWGLGRSGMRRLARTLALPLPGANPVNPVQNFRAYPYGLRGLVPKPSPRPYPGRAMYAL